MSPILFNIVVDMLTILLGRAKDDGQVGGLVPHLVDGGISILQYADDTIIFMEHDLTKARNMKLVLCLFEQLTGLKLTSTRANCSVSEELMMTKRRINNC